MDISDGMERCADLVTGDNKSSADWSRMCSSNEFETIPRHPLCFNFFQTVLQLNLMLYNAKIQKLERTVPSIRMCTKATQ